MTVDDGLEVKVALGRNDGDHIADLKVVEDGIRIMSLVGDQRLWRGTRPGHDGGVAHDAF
jgi:hypothetical protein